MSRIPKKTGEKRRDVGYKKPPAEHRFQPGNKAAVGNGRPKGESLTAKIRRALEKASGEECEADALAKAVVRYARRGGKGDFSYFKEIIDRLDGKVPERNNVGGKVVIEIVHGDDVGESAGDANPPATAEDAPGPAAGD